MSEVRAEGSFGIDKILIKAQQGWILGALSGHMAHL